jgi:hypothetical protein
MPIVVRKKAGFNRETPPEGLHQAVCCDVWEPWTEKNKFRDDAIVEKTRIVWQIDQLGENGRPLEISKKYTMSLHEKSNLRKDLESWRGKKLTEKEVEGFDLEQLIGANCQVQVVHEIKDDGGVWANVQAIVPIGKNTQKIVVGKDFVRKVDRDRAAGGETGLTPPEDEDVDDTGVPF